MKIEISSKPGNRDVRTILIDGEPWRDIHIAVFGRRPSLPKAETLEAWQEAFTRLEYKQAKNYVLRRLTAQSYHSQQLAKLLKERLISTSLIPQLIQECKDYGYLNDKAWLDSFIRGRLKRHSRRAILSKLYAKGINLEEAEEVLNEYHQPEEEELAIKKLLETRYRSRNLEDYKERQKVIAALMRKGYSFEMIQRLIALK